MRSWGEWWLVARAATLIAVLTLTRPLPYAAWRRLAVALSRLRAGEPGIPIDPRLIVRALNTASRVVPGPRPLNQPQVVRLAHDCVSQGDRV